MQIPDVLKWLGERRDGLLMGVAGLYGLGYLVWTINAARNGLGQLPALEFQYIAAGVVPALLIALVYAAIAFFHDIQERLIGFFERHRLVGWLGVLAILGIVLLSEFAPWDRDMVALYSGPLIFFLAYTVQTSKYKSGRLAAFSEFLYRYATPAAFCLYALAAYLSFYQGLPQVLGGPRPHCANVDLVRAEASAETWAALSSEIGHSQSGDVWAGVVRSKKLHVYFSASDYLLVRVAADDDAKPEDAPLYEVPRSAIRTVHWCQ